MTDIFNYADRAGFLERLGRLAGQTTFREAGGGGSPYSARMMTTENALVLALSFARRDVRDIGPEIAYAIGTGIPHQQERVMFWLDIKFQRDAGYEGRRLQLRAILSRHCYELVAIGKPITRLPRESRLPKSWDTLRNIGTGWLWMQAESTVERAEHALRSAGTHKPHKMGLDTRNVGVNV
jgi:hypothetical protein